MDLGMGAGGDIKIQSIIVDIGEVREENKGSRGEKQNTSGEQPRVWGNIKPC